MNTAINTAINGNHDSHQKDQEGAMLELIEYKAHKEHFSEDHRLICEAVALRSLQAGASTFRALENGLAAARELPVHV